MYTLNNKKRLIKELSNIKLSKDDNYKLINKLIHKNDKLIDCYLFLSNT